MLSWLQRQDCLNRSNALYDFYDRVMNDFFERLYREYKHKKGLVDEEKISDFQEVLPPTQRVKDYLSKTHTVTLFNSCVKMKEGSSRLDEIIREDELGARPQLKIEHQD